jgi:hypothetical protein
MQKKIFFLFIFFSYNLPAGTLSAALMKNVTESNCTLEQAKKIVKFFHLSSEYVSEKYGVVDRHRLDANRPVRYQDSILNLGQFNNRRRIKVQNRTAALPRK